MLRQAAIRLAGLEPRIVVQPLSADLPSGPFDAIVSALAIHHLDDAGKRGLYSRILAALSPNGIFITAEQVAGRSARLQNLFEAVHLDRARALGSSEAEIAGAIQRMSYDQCGPATRARVIAMHEAFADLEDYAKHVIKTTGRPAEEIRAEFIQRHRREDFLKPLLESCRF